MDRVPFWKAPLLAPFAPAPYRAAARAWRGWGLGYLLFVAALAWLPLTLRAAPALELLAAELTGPVATALPRLEVVDGRLAAVDAATPHEIRLSDGTVAIVVDPEGDVRGAQRRGASLLLARERIFLLDGAGGVAANPWPPGDYALDGARLRAWVARARPWVAALSFPVGALGSFGLRAAQAFLIGLATLLLARASGRALDYAGAVRLTAVALSVLLLLRAGLELLGLVPPAWWLVSLGTTLVYVVYGVRALEPVPAGDAAR